MARIVNYAMCQLFHKLFIFLKRGESMIQDMLEKANGIKVKTSRDVVRDVKLKDIICIKVIKRKDYQYLRRG